MFFSLKMEPGNTYVGWTQNDLHLSGVAFEKGDIAKIYVKYQKKMSILGTVSQVIPQALLNLDISGGEQITFTAKGNATVSLLGYWSDDDYSYMMRAYDNEEPFKFKVVKASPKANAKKVSKKQNGVAAKKEEKDYDKENLSLLGNVDKDVSGEEVSALMTKLNKTKAD
ncbi:39 kDa FK506-binding nuclear protein-like [Drosophila kikkawai]|uniref:39 kDa FK506-binding nuclear protein-like n=1 Tax=Drosophila kikkawai TaxID=30033 RepID=A0A6P4J9N2_DROKI|nr:uncharacterized protein LOC108081216 [Drosophila kikkawai]